MEAWDILDENGVLTGKTILRSKTLGPGEYHLVVHIWIFDTEGNTLIQKRADHLCWEPGIWAATGGSAIKGEDSITAIIRETKEELGLEILPENVSKIMRTKGASDFCDIWVTKGPRIDFASIKYCSDVADVRWVTWGVLLEMVRKREFISYENSYFEMLSQFFSRETKVCNTNV
jgi:8-oxo-dGTP diphosphatase